MQTVKEKRELINALEQRINTALVNRKSEIQYKLQGSYGRTSIEMYKGDVMIKTLRSDLKTDEVLTVLVCMESVLLDGLPL